MSPQSIVRKQARDALKNQYAPAVISFIIMLIPIVIIDGAATALVCALYSIVTDKAAAEIISSSIVYSLFIIGGFLLSPVINGYIRVFYLNALNGEMDVRQMYYYFEKSRYNNTLSLNLRYFARMFLPALLLFSPVIIYDVLIMSLAQDFYDSVLYKDVYFILFVLSTVTTTLYSLRYFTVFTLKVEMEYIDNKELFAYSKAIMKDKTVSAAKLIFSFTPWMLLCLTILPILYVAPYMTQALCIGAKWMTRATYEVNIR